MAGLLPFFSVLAASLLFSESFKRLNLPYVTALIVAGILIGPHSPIIGGGLTVSFMYLPFSFDINPIVPDETIELLGSIGVVFLMFIAGSEVKMSSFRSLRKDVFVLSFLNGVIPLLMGFFLGYMFGYGFFPSLILGIVFISSSIAVIIPSLEANGLMHTRLGKDLITATVFEDMGSLLLLSLILQKFTQKSPIPLELYIVIVVVLLFLLKKLIPWIQELYYFDKSGKDLFESELRFVFVVLIATVLLFEAIGMHSIVAGFVIGIILSDTIRGKVEEKIRTISYGLFIPIFFLIVGMQTDLSVFASLDALLLPAMVVFCLFVSKVASGWSAARLVGFSSREGLLIGVATTPQLSTTLAAAFAAMSLGLLDNALITSLVFLSVVTTFVTPLGIRFLSPKKEKSKS
ncbi:cation:proton antiporter [archaeon]|nr:cation:proton antiporter [archaeon]